MQFCSLCYLLFHKNSKDAQNDNNDAVLEHSACDCWRAQLRCPAALRCSTGSAMVWKRSPPSGRCWEVLNDKVNIFMFSVLRSREKKRITIHTLIFHRNYYLIYLQPAFTPRAVACNTFKAQLKCQLMKSSPTPSSVRINYSFLRSPRVLFLPPLRHWLHCIISRGVCACVHLRPD